jgi:tRNA/tmRNA/rRNA uracil-C5-methylase (TrmA/RlmC/RlmD family)
MQQVILSSMPKSNIFSFSEILFKSLRPDESNRTTSDIEPLASVPYSLESVAKNEALHEFWKKNRLYGSPGIILPSPKPRHYRTTTKRRIFFSHGKFRLRFSHYKDEDPQATMLCSELEPKEHSTIYRFLLEKINTPGFSVAAKHLTYFIIRGTYTEFSVIFNVHQVNGQIVRNVKALAENLRSLDVNIVSSFIFFDPTRSDYYLDHKQNGSAWKFKNLFGPDTLKLRAGDLTYLLDPLSFSQINQSMLPALLDRMTELSKPDPHGRFIDLYCGYGLFANYIGRRFGEVYAVDSDTASIKRGDDTACYMAKKKLLKARIHFRAGGINPSSLEALLPMAGGKSETILLDPPRQGPGKGVIPFCGQRMAGRIIHLFCAVDRIPEDLQQWRESGYRITDVVAFDMFPGTPNLEVAVVLEP